MHDRLLATSLLALLLSSAGPPPAAAQGSSLKLVATAPRPHDYLGTVALDGDLLVVGAMGFGALDGAVYVFDRFTGERRLRLTSANGAAGQALGQSVAVHAGVVVAGAPWGTSHQGVAYAFDAVTGAQLFELRPSTPLAQSYFGMAVAIDERFIAVGAPGNPLSAPDEGTLHLFDRTSGAGLRRIASPDPGGLFVPINHFGTSLALESGLLLVGATGVDLVGAAYLFDAGTGAQLRKLVPPPGSDPSGFGTSVALRGNRALVGAPTALGARGAAHVYDLSTAQLLFSVADAQGQPGDHFGTSVALGDALLAVGSAHDTVGPYQGSVHVFEAATGAKTSVLLGHPAPRTHRFGASLALDRGQLAVGDPQDSQAALYAGAAYMFQLW